MTNAWIPADLGALQRRVRLQGYVETLTALRVGAAASLRATEADLPVVRNGAGTPFLPGSSIKGALRSILEGLLRGLGKDLACDPITDQCCKPREEDRDRERELSTEEILRKSCLVCQLFGNTAIAGRVLFADLPLVPGTRHALPLERRDHVGIDRDTETAANHIKFDQEVVSGGERFSLEVVLDNPTPAQIGLLAAGFDALGDMGLGLGGGRSRGLGRVRIVIGGVTDSDARVLLGLVSPGPAPTWDQLATDGRSALAELLGGRE